MASDVPEELGDELTRISELSLAAAERLRRAGVRTYADLAARPPEEIAKITRRLPQRVAELDWVGQARRLAAGSAAGEDLPQGPAEEDRQHYESFTVRLLLEKDNTVRRLSAKHTRTLHEEAWNGWEPARLVDFIARQAGVRTELGPKPGEAAAAPVAVAAPAQAPRPATPWRRTQLQVKEVEVMDLVHAGEPFTVRLTIDLSRLEMKEEPPLEYTASVVARLPGRERRTVGETQGKLDMDTGAATAVIEVPGPGGGLPAGLYELNVAVRFRDPATAQPVAFAAVLEGQVLHVL